ncbi:MAG: nuclear transport factor 2 family protein [Acidimicrobiales bacterium]
MAEEHDGATQPRADAATGTGDLVETVRQIQEALGRGDILAPMAHFSRQVRWAVACQDRQAAPFFKEYTGRSGIAAFMQDMDVVDMTSFEIRSVFGQGDLVTVVLHMAFTTPAGGTVDMDEVQIWTFAGGKVVAVDLFPDTQAVAAAFA